MLIVYDNNTTESVIKKLNFFFNSMPQIIPFYFLSQIIITLFLLFSVIFVLSKYILPLNLFTQVIRSYITNLTK